MCEVIYSCVVSVNDSKSTVYKHSLYRGTASSVCFGHIGRCGFFLFFVTENRVHVIYSQF